MSETTSNPTPAPEFGGKCAFGVGLGGPSKAPEGKPQHTVVKDGKTYVFSSAIPKMLFNVIPGSAERAHKKWGTGNA
ncbi:MAG: hypothetical protein J2O46_02895 [Nocardioides sp.]|nr:hypothetical protein [Nocardioides sp.]